MGNVYETIMTQLAGDSLHSYQVKCGMEIEKCAFYLRKFLGNIGRFPGCIF